LIDRKEQGVTSIQWGWVLGVGSGDGAVPPLQIKCFEFSSKYAKMQRFIHFYCDKITCDQKPRLGGPENVKRTGVEHLAGGSTTPKPSPRQLAPW